MAEPSASESSPETDRDFDPSAEMLVNDFDDERTLEEEEAMESGEDVQNELDELQKEGDMPLEDLLAMYGGYADGNQADTMQSSSSEEILSNQDLTLDKDEIARDLLPDHDDDEEGKSPSVHDLLENMDATVPTSRLLRSAVPHHQSESESESEDVDYVPDDDDDWKKTIQVGTDFQAQIPDGLCKYDGAPAYENDDKLLWDPSMLEPSQVDEYLRQVMQPVSGTASLNSSGAGTVNLIPTGCHVRDDEQALYLLLQCGHNIDEALRRRRMQSVPPTDTMSLWSEEECRSFESGLRTYGKDFHLIQQNRVRTRSVGELVQFYYLWKKTERHDVFANKARLEKKKYSLHPGTTDYMDRFLDEHENPSAHRDRSSSPNIHSLISGDHKRQQHHHHHGQHHRVATSSSSSSSASLASTATTAAASGSDHPQHFDGPGSFPLPTEFNMTSCPLDNTAIVALSSNTHHHPSSSSSSSSSSSLVVRSCGNGDLHLDLKHHVLPPTLEDLAKNLSQGLDHDNIVDTLTGGTTTNNSTTHHNNNVNNSSNNNVVLTSTAGGTDFGPTPEVNNHNHHYHNHHRGSHHHLHQVTSLKNIEMSISSVNNSMSTTGTTNSIGGDALLQATAAAASSFAQ